MRIIRWLGDAFIRRTFALFFFACVSERLIFPSSCIDYSATSAPSRGTNGYVASVKTTSTGATPAFLPKHGTRNPSTFGPNVLTGGCRRSGSKSKVYAKRAPPVNCANESTVSRNTTRAPSGSTTRALSENSVAIIFLWCSPGGHYFSLVPECRSFVLAPRAFFW